MEKIIWQWGSQQSPQGFLLKYTSPAVSCGIIPLCCAWIWMKFAMWLMFDPKINCLTSLHRRMQRKSYSSCVKEVLFRVTRRVILWNDWRRQQKCWDQRINELLKPPRILLRASPFPQVDAAPYPLTSLSHHICLFSFLNITGTNQQTSDCTSFSSSQELPPFHHG